ncbi:autotransporter domain-containing protein [Herbaspirillum sp. C7C2]|uniref:autotransporter outer membrane beta-barrel domain-containing protein n=1 Tax=Herbaspirillum sp. C7C2 TaxID=2736666 RepID=UPI001F526F86|nr:autotransporter domain-containing protein [Herbaspirillum sp. C7C2]MCI1015403.1 autotransporter domain-containing protein [Herbaspirillum sp. C7C2]
MKGLVLKAVAAAAMLACAQTQAQTQAQTYESHTILDRNQVPIFEARFYGPADGDFQKEGDTFQSSPFALSDMFKQQTLAGLRQWANYIKVIPGTSPAVINIGSEDGDDNAHADSPLVPGLRIAPTQVQAALQNLQAGKLTLGAHGFVGIGNLPVSTNDYIPSQLPRNVTGWDLPAVAFHEIGHALGIGSDVKETEQPSGPSVYNFSDRISQWTAHLRDDNGKAAQPGQVIWCMTCSKVSGADVFDVSKNSGYFIGPNVAQVLAGSGMRGIPLSTGTETDSDPPFMSHLELKNSLMSHQSYRNYTTFMEAELAILQDLGYDIDRRNFFGRSVYADGQVILNDDGFFQRNAEGSAYLPNTYNLATLGLGLHVYGSNNTIYQRADLLSAGAGGAGMRIDGAGNHIIILPGTRVYADGAYGRGVMFTYGKDHTLTQRGDVQALGEDGIAVSFDFGNNILGNDSDYRGSYIYRGSKATGSLLAELDGPLVSRFDLTGRLAGRSAAIYISSNAYVGQINVMRGASLQGDIRSDYAELDGSAPRLTILSFGYLPDGDGRATASADPGFALRYDGNIVGIDNLSLAFEGGTTFLTGDHQIYQVNIAQGALLGGSSRYTLNSAGLFTNHGTLAPTLGSNITVVGNYAQGADGRLQTSVDGSGNISSLIVSGNAALDGSLTIAPQRSWYANRFALTSDQWLQAGSVSGAFASASALLASPTLVADVSAAGGLSYTVSVQRRDAAYSRYANDDVTLQVARSLDVAAGNARGDMRSLVAALDFSAADGGAIAPALRQLSPVAYGEMFSGALLRERHIGDLVAARAPAVTMLDGQVPAGSDWTAFAMPFGSAYWRDRSERAVGANGNTYGVVLGVERSGLAMDGWTVGLHGAVSGQSTRVDGRTPASGETSALDVGAHLAYAADPLAGPHAFAQARVGVEDGRLERKIGFNGYQSAPRGTWTGTVASATLGGGWRWRIGEGSSAGPLAGLDYTVLSRPAITENNTDGPGLQLDSNSLRSMRARLGGEWRSDLSLASGRQVRANLRAGVSRDMLARTTTQTARLAGYPDVAFAASSEVIQRDSLDLQAGASYRVRQDMVVDASLSSTLWRGGDAELTAAVSANWRF